MPDAPVRAGRRRELLWVWLELALIIAVGAALRIWGIGFGLPHTQARPDETQVMDVALNYLRGNAWPAFYDYPRLYTYLLLTGYLAYYALGWIAGWFSSIADLVASWPVHWEPFFLINRSLSATAGILTIPVVYALGCAATARRGVGGGRRDVGLVAAAFMALAYLHGRDSHFGTTDMTLVLLCALAVLCLLRSHVGGDVVGTPRRGWMAAATSGQWDLLAAGAAGLAAATKYNGVILLLPLGLSQVWHALERRRIASLVDGRAWAMAAAFGLAFAVGVPFVFFDFERFWPAMRELHAVLSVGLAPREPVNGWWYHSAVSLRHGLGLPLVIAALVGAAWAVRRDLRVGLLLISFPLAYFAVAGSLGAQFVRYALPIVPFACVTGAIALVAGAERALRGRVAAQHALVALLGLAIIYPSAARLVAFDRLIDRTDSRVVAADWIARHAEPGASVAVSGSPFGSPQFRRTLQHWVWNGRARAFTLQRQPVSGRPDWILVQESPLPSATQEAVTAWLASGYERTTTIRAFDPSVTGNLYDRQDGFFLPFAAFKRVRRAGPNFTIYKLPSARDLSGPDIESE